MKDKEFLEVNINSFICNLNEKLSPVKNSKSIQNRFQSGIEIAKVSLLPFFFSIQDIKHFLNFVFFLNQHEIPQVLFEKNPD